MPKQRLSLSWGSSFAESQKGPHWMRVYTPNQPIPALLKNLSGGEPVDLRLSLTVMRRILDTRLGNSVAQIVTQGFEQWVLLRQEPNPGRFDLSPARREPLANPENLFGLPERLSATGEVLKSLEVRDLEKIAVDLKKKGIERVCVNLLFANRNSEHQVQAENFLREKGFQVFSRARGSQSRDELSAWRRNLLDASLASFFEKIRSEIEEALPGSDITFLDTEKGFVPWNEVSTSGLLFGRERLLQQKKPLIYLGPEEWVWIRPDDQALWQSPWGQIELEHPRCGFFSMQPGRDLALDPEGRLRWGPDSGMDPGPMLWGRSSKLTLLDLLGWQFETTPALRRTEKTEAKVHEQIEAMKKHSRDWNKTSAAQMQKELRSQLVESLINDLVAFADSEEFLVAGALAADLFPAFKEARPKWKWTLRGDSLHETSTFEES